MDLLSIIAPIKVNKGKGGKAGLNGRGGNGGPGGRGGSSYSWTTTSYSALCKGQGRSLSKTHTHHHTNPGGSDGPIGTYGKAGSAKT